MGDGVGGGVTAGMTTGMTETFDAHLRGSDAFAWYMERDPLLRSTIVAVLTFDRAPDFAAFCDRLDRVSRIVPGMRHRLVEPPMRLAPPRWTVVDDFDLSYHVRHVRAAPPCTNASLLELARTAGMAGFDEARPLWELTLVEGLDDGCAAAILKVHHSIMDGIGGMQLATHLFDLEREPGPLGPMPDAPAPEPASAPALVVDALAYQGGRLASLPRRGVPSLAGAAARAVRDPLGAAGATVETARSIARTVRPMFHTRSPLMQRRRLGWHYDVLEVPLDAMRRAAKQVDGTVNDVFVAGVAGGLHRYHLRHGLIVDELRVTLPISIRRDGDPEGGNRITLMRVPVPVGLVDPEARMRAVHSVTNDARLQRSIPYTNTIASAMNLLPRAVVAGMLKHVDFVASNVPGVSIPLYLGGARVERMIAFGPTIGSAVNCTLVSYCGTCSVGVNSDVGAVPDPDVLLDALCESFAQVLAVGGDEFTIVRPTRAPGAAGRGFPTR